MHELNRGSRRSKDDRPALAFTMTVFAAFRSGSLSQPGTPAIVSPLLLIRTGPWMSARPSMQTGRPGNRQSR